MKSLDEVLNLTGSDAGIPSGDGLPEVPSKLTAKTVCAALLASPQYREALRRRILSDTLPPAVEVRLWEYAYGKPLDRVHLSVQDETLALTPEELRERAERVVARLREIELGGPLEGNPVVH